ncbi:Sgs1p [Rhizophagus irregularis DAOM 197198w]|uniref:DNA 3'-5' helicase n=1 Tax=Rhizophagus irregularis (strain DAOM 197198w) TaxID=1432141 RepID=A0A015MNJ5_RHIIW|nr:Sgs1p [Rhizophagus irregularis DAOM 197198w]
MILKHLIGPRAQYNIDAKQFHPSFALHIPDFNETMKCIACHAFLKCTAKGLCRVCRFYIENGLWNQIVDKNYQPKIEKPVNISFEIMCTSALHGIYQFNDFRSGQKEAIQSFVQNQDTVIIKQTGGGKSLYYTIAALLSQGITVIFSPLKALIDDQVMELIKAGIPCCGLYASTEQPLQYQKKIFEEIACGLTKVACLNLFKILRLVSSKFYYRFIIVSAEFWQFRHL